MVRDSGVDEGSRSLGIKFFFFFFFFFFLTGLGFRAWIKVNLQLQDVEIRV